jgi:CTP:molybdopterin cytidylyltransferase MocA
VSTAGLILSAGESRRMGTAKALLHYAGETFLDRLVGLLARRCDPVIVVLGAGAGEIEARAVRRARFVRNADYQRGQTSSMQCGLREVPAEADGVLFTLVDHPAVAPATIDALLAPAGQGEASSRPLVRVPRYRGRRGHPVWFSRELIAEFLALPEGAAARDVVHKHAERTGFIDLDDPGIVADIDDPAAYRGLVETGL